MATIEHKLVVKRDTRANQPAASAANEGMLYCVTDEGNKQERSNGSAWQPYTERGEVLLAEYTASASASIDVTSIITSIWDVYVIDLVSIIPATDNVDLIALASTNNGSSWDSASNYAFFYELHPGSGSFSSGVSTSTTSFPIAGNLENTTADGGLSGDFKFFNPMNASSYKSALGNFVFAHESFGVTRTTRWYRYNSITAVNALQFKMTSGNIASGKIRVYGKAK